MISLNMILGPFEEPFLQAALDSAHDLCDEFVIVDTSPGNNPNMEIVHEWFTKHIWEISDEAFTVVNMPRGEDKDFSFASARELARKNTRTDWFLRLDADEVLHEDSIDKLKEAVVWCNTFKSYSAVEAAFYHFMVYPWLYQYKEAKTILFKTKNMSWHNGVHELPSIRGSVHNTGVLYHHYGYVRPQEEVFKRWQLYVEIDGRPNWYAGRDPGNILTDRISVCQPFEGTHPKYVIEKLKEMFPE